MARSIDDTEKRLAELMKEATKRGFDRHALLLKNISELPIELQSTAVTALSARGALQTMIVFPPQIQRGWHYVPKQALLFTDSGVIHLLASIWPNQEPQVTCLEGCGLMYMKVTLLLLYGFLEIVTQGPDAPTRLGMEFNTVSWYCLSPPLRLLLRATETTSDRLADRAILSSTAKQAFEKLPLKFSNGVKIYGLLPGEELEELVFEACTWKRWLIFFRRPVSTNTLLMLTTNYVVIIQEELDVNQGWILSYIPRNSIAGIQNQVCGLWNDLSVHLRRGDQSIAYKLMLKSDTIEAWHSRWIQHGGLWQDLPAQQN
jgi:hypothetical protein